MREQLDNSLPPISRRQSKKKETIYLEKIKKIVDVFIEYNNLGCILFWVDRFIIY